MPQITIEFSSNIHEKSNLEGLLKKIHLILAENLPAEVMACKGRAVERDVYCVGDGASENAFIHMDLKVMPGRTTQALEKVGKMLMDFLKGYFSQSFEALNLQITLEISELQKTYFKVASR